MTNREGPHINVSGVLVPIDYIKELQQKVLEDAQKVLGDMYEAWDKELIRLSPEKAGRNQQTQGNVNYLTVSTADSSPARPSGGRVDT